MSKLCSTAGALFAASAIAPHFAVAQTVPANAPLPGLAAIGAAKTIRVMETSYRHNTGDQALSPQERIDITLESGGKYRISVLNLNPDAVSHAPDLFVTDGTKATEYVAASNQCLIRTLATDPTYQKYKALGSADFFGLSPVLKLGFKSRFDMLADGFRKELKVPAGGTSRTTQTSLNGQPATLVIVTTPPAKDARVVTTDIRLWLNAKSGLPMRFENYYVKDGKEHVFDQIDYTNWVIDKPIAPATFTWAAPSTATVYPDDSLLAVGTRVPDFSAITADGKTVHLSDFKGRAVILDFWATWCVPCQESMPHLESVYRQIKGQPVTVLAICVWDTKAAYTRWVAAKKETYSFPTVFDPAENAASSIAQSKFGIHAIPTQYLIDKDGNVAFAKTDGYKPGDHDLEDALAKLNITTKTQTATAAR